MFYCIYRRARAWIPLVRTRYILYEKLGATLLLLFFVAREGARDHPSLAPFFAFYRRFYERDYIICNRAFIIPGRDARRLGVDG